MTTYDAAMNRVRRASAKAKRQDDEATWARQARDELIREAYAIEGRDRPTMEELAEASGLSKAMVGKIVNGGQG